MVTTEHIQHSPPEGHLPAGVRPDPGIRGVRPVWFGEQMDPQDAAAAEQAVRKSDAGNEAEADVAANPRAAATHHSSQKPSRRGPLSMITGNDDQNQRRMIGIDVARGAAMLGMVAVHTLPVWNEAAQRPTFSWLLAAGHASAIFAILAGVGLALLTKPRDSVELELVSRVSLATRALLILGVGLTVNLLAVPVANILTYYGLFFILAIPFTLMRFRALLVSAAVFFLGSPFVVHIGRRDLAFEQIANPSFVDLVQDPAGVLMSLLVVGSYPAVTWMGFICLGLAVGQLPVTRAGVQSTLLAAGAGIAVVAYASSHLLVWSFGVSQLLQDIGGVSATEVYLMMYFGPDSVEPATSTTTMWWLSVVGPHTNTPFALVFSAGVALMVLGASLLLCRVAGQWLAPLAAVGTMVLTLYTSHMVLLSVIDLTTPWLWFLIQVAVAMLFAVAWQRAVGRGPLEALTSSGSRAASRRFVGSMLRTGLKTQKGEQPTRPRD